MFYNYEPISGLPHRELHRHIHRFLGWLLNESSEGRSYLGLISEDGHGFAGQLLDSSQFKDFYFTGERTRIYHSHSNIGIKHFTIQLRNGDRVMRYCPERHRTVTADEVELSSLTLDDIVEFVPPESLRPLEDYEAMVCMVSGLFQEVYGVGKRRSRTLAREFITFRRDNLDLWDTANKKNVDLAIAWYSQGLR